MRGTVMSAVLTLVLIAGSALSPVRAGVDSSVNPVATQIAPSRAVPIRVEGIVFGQSNFAIAALSRRIAPHDTWTSLVRRNGGEHPVADPVIRPRARTVAVTLSCGGGAGPRMTMSYTLCEIGFVLPLM